MNTMFNRLRNAVAAFHGGAPNSGPTPATPALIELEDGAACLVIVQDGKVLHYTGDLALSHAEFVKRTVRALPEGAWVGTIRKFSGALVALSSRTFYGNQLPAPPEVMTAIQGVFR